MPGMGMGMGMPGMMGGMMGGGLMGGGMMGGGMMGGAGNPTLSHLLGIQGGFTGEHGLFGNLFALQIFKDDYNLKY